MGITERDNCKHISQRKIPAIFIDGLERIEEELSQDIADRDARAVLGGKPRKRVPAPLHVLSLTPFHFINNALIYASNDIIVKISKST